MGQALKVINFGQSISNRKFYSSWRNIQNSVLHSSIIKLLVLFNFIFALSVIAFYILDIDLIKQYRITFFVSVLNSISFAGFLLGTIRNNRKSYKLKLLKDKDFTNSSANVLLNDSIIPYFQLTLGGDFICNNKSLSSLLKIEPSKSVNLFNNFLKNDKIKKHILIKLENNGEIENYKFWLTNNNKEKIYVSMSCKYFYNTKILEGSFTDITSQYLKEKSISEEIEKLKTEVLISKNKTELEITDKEITSKLGHELKLSLNSILGFLTLIENKHYETDEELIEFSQNAKKAGEQLLKTIEKQFVIENINKKIIEPKKLSSIENILSVETQISTKKSTINFTITDFDVNRNSGPNILLVEDNLLNQEVEIKLLEKVGYNVFAVQTGEEAIEQVKTNKFDLVLMDIELPGMSGMEATRKIRNLAQHLSNIPVIAATAKSSMKDRERCLNVGMNDYISKPINISFMKMTIDQWLNYKKAA